MLPHLSHIFQINQVKTVKSKSNFPPLPASHLSPVSFMDVLTYNQNHFQLNNHKIGLADSEASSAHNMCQHRVPFPSIVENGWVVGDKNCF